LHTDRINYFRPLLRILDILGYVPPENAQMLQSGVFTLLQTTTSPDEKLVNVFNSFVSTVNTTIAIVGILVAALTLAVAIAAIATPIILNNLDRKIKERTEDRVSLAIAQSESKVKQSLAEIDQVVQRRVQQELTTLRRRTQYLEKLLEREIVIEKTIVDYYVPNPLNRSMPEGLKMLKARGFQADITSTLDEFTGDIVILDLVHHPSADAHTDEQVESYLSAVIPYMQNHILIVYVPGQFPCLRKKRSKPAHIVSANFLISFLGTTIGAAYVADGMRSNIRT